MDAALLYLIPALFISAILAVGAAVNSGPKHPRHAAPRHVEEDEPEPPVWGSMDLDAELALGMTLLAAPVDPEPWRARITAELSPEALDAEPREFLTTVPGTRMTIYTDGEIEFTDPPADPGAGDVDVVSSAPAPDPDWLAAQMAATFDWVRAMVPRVTGWRVSA